MLIFPEKSFACNVGVVATCGPRACSPEAVDFDFKWPTRARQPLTVLGRASIYLAYITQHIRIQIMSTLHYNHAIFRFKQTLSNASEYVIYVLCIKCTYNCVMNIFHCIMLTHCLIPLDILTMQTEAHLAFFIKQSLKVRQDQITNLLQS